MIEVSGLVKYYGSERALSGIGFSIQRGEVVGFLGPNGAGKTTTLRILTGYLFPTAGTVNILGHSIGENAIEVKKRIGYLPESNPLYQDMNTLEYLEFIAEMRGIPRDKIKSRLCDISGACGLLHVLKKNISELSKGYRQRVGIAQAMMHDPEILIMDEPTSGLDPNQIVEIRDLIRELGKEKTVILSTHILSEVQATCDRVIIINRGEIAADGKTEEINRFVAGNEELILKLPPGTAGVNDIFSGIPGVMGVKTGNLPSGEIEVIIESRQGDDLRERVFRCAVLKNIVILEQARRVLSLEDVFRKLTTETNSSPENNGQVQQVSGERQPHNTPSPL